ncbi:MAG: hypothetical protein LPK47_03790 [Bacteroidota bacterium]|nr:hypothetical protein [Bacteroidota bacterium]
MGPKKNLIFCLTLLTGMIQAQVVIRVVDPPKDLPRKVSYFEAKLDSTTMNPWREERLRTLHEAGFVTAQLIPRMDSSNIIWTWDFGKSYSFRTIRLVSDSVRPSTLPDSIANVPLSPSAFSKVMDDVLSSFENSGFPFASVKWKVLSWEDQEIQAELKVDPGPYITIDSIAVKGFDRFPRGFLKYGLDLKVPKPYDERFLLGLQERTQRTPYLQMIRPPQVAFSREGNVAFLYFEKRNANRFDGVIGLNTTDDGTVTLNGSIDLFLTNIFGGGEAFTFAWKRPDDGIQQLDIELGVPYILNTPIWLNGEFGLFNRDSSFTNRSYGIEFRYQVQSRGFIKLGYKGASSNLLPYGEGLAGFGNTSTQKAVIGFSWSDTRGRIPRKGYSLALDYGTGSRQTDDGGQGLSEFNGEITWYGNIWRNHHFVIGSVAEWLFSENLFQNELYRIGGLKTLRGFNEQSIYASQYVKGTVEYRYFFEESSFLQVFSDLAWTSNPSSLIGENLLTGIGAGFTFTTGGGVFSLAYALGKNQDTSFDLRTGKVHFGYINTF